MAETFLEEFKRYVAFAEADERALRALHRAAEPSFPAIAEAFYARILDHEGARRALAGGEAQVGALKVTLQRFMAEALLGPWDEAFFERHCRIGRVHVAIDLPQHYMFAAMNLLREELSRVADHAFASDPEARSAARRALHKVLDLELAVMLHSYREDHLERAARSARLATFGQLVGSIAHELRNPLAVMETSLFLLRGRAEKDAGLKKHVERIGDQVRVANEIISDLLEIIRDRPLLREPVELGALVAEAAQAAAPPEEVRLELDTAGLPVFPGDRGQLRQLFLNLLENAVDAVAPRGEVRVVGRAAGRHLLVSVEDSGPGVDPAIRARLFEPLVTGKPSGIGLGLALVKRIAERHGGSVAYEPGEGGGARFTVRLPLEP